VADELNFIAVTDKSLESMMVAIAWQSRQKNIPGVLGRSPRAFPDITGLREIVGQARELRSGGNLEGAYAKLVQVSCHLDGFKN